ncbi:Uncharacterised protein [Capnocytophaga ochracea]|uniref:Uncharacterized protein n=1 Tax=Capnocytophaga ochracea TaxID=1018 RepID=A0A7Z8YBK5_CAPOC|nr:Uncharacterised protein [Capnocytophaga ochracea]
MKHYFNNILIIEIYKGTDDISVPFLLYALFDCCLNNNR